MLTVANPLTVITNGPVAYVISCYEFIFALTTILQEMPEEWIEQVPKAAAYQDMLEDQCKFLLRMQGRGLFYLFQGSLWLAFATLTKVLDLAVGSYLCFIGAMYIAMHNGVMPEQCISITRTQIASGAQAMKGQYERIGDPPPQPP